MNGETTVKEQPLPKSFAAEVWGNLSRVDVADHIETAQVKNKEGKVMYTYQYLGWAWCWTTLMSIYPDSEFEILPEDHLENGSVMVNVSISVTSGDGVKLCRKMYLPVMDPKNNSQLNPTSRQISDSRMRCIVKCLAMCFGLGLDLWTGSDYPVGVEKDPISSEQFDLLQGLFAKLPAERQDAFLVTYGIPALQELPIVKYQPARMLLERAIKQATV